MKYLNATLSVVGLGMLGVGLSLAWMPLGFIVVGALVLWSALPD